MFPSVLSRYSNLKRRLFCSNQRIFAGRLPIDFFYFEDFEWSIFGKLIGQKRSFENAFVGSDLTLSFTKFFVFFVFFVVP